jgi:metallo-beta-lactamase class B
MSRGDKAGRAWLVRIDRGVKKKVGPMKLLKSLVIACQLSVLPLVANAELSPESAAKNLPVPPLRIVGNVYYVGASDVASYLVESSAGLVLIDAGFAETAPQIEGNIRALGFKLGDVKILLIGHAHPDHVGGLAALQRDTGARVAAMDAEVLPLENNGRGTFYRGDRRLFESVKVDRILHDRDRVELGGVVLVAHHTAGHTPGCTTWTLKTSDRGRAHNVVFFCQLTSPEGEALTKNPDYPHAVTDFKRTFGALRRLPCDVPLAEHGTAFHLTDKLRGRADDHANPFIDPAGCRELIDAASKEFDEHVAR